MIDVDEQKININKILDLLYIELMINDKNNFLNLLKEKIPFVLDDYSFKPLLDSNLYNTTIYNLLYFLTEPGSYTVKNIVLTR